MKYYITFMAFHQLSERIFLDCQSVHICNGKFDVITV